MPEMDIQAIADTARFIVNGYAFSRRDDGFHVHASDRKMTEANSAKFFVRADGSTVLKHRGDLTDREISIISRFIQVNYMDMYKTWKDFGGGDFYRG